MLLVLGKKGVYCPSPTLLFHPDPKTFYWTVYNIVEILSSSGTYLANEISLTVKSVSNCQYKNITNNNS
jgi:hypothetical protein